MPTIAKRPYRGVFPVAPTIFDVNGNLDLDGQRRCIDFMIDAGSHGICILANFSEQFVLTDAERETVMHTVLEHVAGRIPVIVTTTHFSSAVCAARSREAETAGAAMVMIMPPYHGATFRVGEPAIYEFYRVVSDAIGIPIMIQDAPVAGTPAVVAQGQGGLLDVALDPGFASNRRVYLSFAEGGQSAGGVDGDAAADRGGPGAQQVFGVALVA